MRRSGRVVAVAVIVIGIARGSLFGQEAERQVGPDATAAELWQKMHEAGMLTAEEYQHALDHGTLPTSANRETQAAKTPPTARKPAGQRNEIAPAARRERAQARLEAFATRMRDKYAPKREAARNHARELGIPVREELPSGHGAVDDIVGGYTQPGDVVMSSFSCFGPTDDGRIKPDVVANGIGLITPFGSSDFSYASYSGTSFSAPSVAGSLGLLQQLHEQLHGTNQPLLASTYKGLVIHTADEAGSHAGPDYRFGWGLMNTFSAARLMTNNAAYNSKPHIKEVTIPDGEQVLFHVLADTSMPLRVTLCWTDPPAPLPPQYQLDPTNLVLVNDLDLRVIAPNGTTNYPWVLDPSNPTNAATTGDNIRDNVEQVHIQNPTTGIYAVVVCHKGVLTNDVQDASILVSGNVPEDIDIIFTEIALTSGASRVEWVGAVGSIHTVMSSTNLLQTNGWTALSDDISIIREFTAWTDEGSTNTAEACRFYRIREVK